MKKSKISFMNFFSCIKRSVLWVSFHAYRTLSTFPQNLSRCVLHYVLQCLLQCLLQCVLQCVLLIVLQHLSRGVIDIKISEVSFKSHFPYTSVCIISLFSYI